MKIVAAPLMVGFDDDNPADLEIVLYSHADRPGRSGVGAHIPEIIQRLKLRPANRAWDFLSLALAVQATDSSVERGPSPDGWTRELDLTVAVIEPEFWNKQSGLLNSLLQFLTTDIWNVRFKAGGIKPPPPSKPYLPAEDCVSLLSGGLDSLVGAIDLSRRDKRAPYLVSQVSNGDKTNQKYFASTLGLSHLQLNHVTTTPAQAERSQRSRSIVFFAYAVLLATTFSRYQSGKTVPLFVCENGLISINPSLTPMRLGSLSTRTTHPAYIHGIQELLKRAQIAVEVSNPYQFETKGEMLKNCVDQTLLTKLASQSTSCGRYARNGFKHCGRCIPCMIRRAAFHAWGQNDGTYYIYKNLAKDDKDHSQFDDVRALGMAAELARRGQLDKLIGASLSFASISNPTPLRDTVSRGMNEVREFLKASGVK